MSVIQTNDRISSDEAGADAGSGDKTRFQLTEQPQQQVASIGTGLKSIITNPIIYIPLSLIVVSGIGYSVIKRK